MRIKYLFCIVMILLFFCGCVRSQNFYALENRVAAMEMENNRQFSKQKLRSNAILVKLQQDFKNLEKKLDQNPTISQEEYADLKYTIQAFKENFQHLEGLMEEINHRFGSSVEKEREVLKKQLEQLDHAVSKNYEKIIRLEKYMGFEPSLEKKPLVNQEISQEPRKDTQQNLYDFAKKLFDDGEKENARIQFENFINKYPDSDNADNARFWIADSYYSEKWFEKAILEYQKVLENYPQSNKLAAARLKQGYAFAELGEKANARLILQELLKKHPDSNEAKYAKKKLIILK
ncbi:MAG: tol-pal system protein YbgF [Desulfobacula sp.]|nr:tol-pal system protein YbgF [Desulfobacula sp.]